MEVALCILIKKDLQDRKTKGTEDCFTMPPFV